MKKKSYNRVLLEIRNEHPISFIPSLARLAGSATAGLFMSQVLYWGNKGRDPDWFYKTIKEFHKETCLTRSEQDNAIRRWKSLGVLHVKLKGIPRRRYFRIDVQKLINLLYEKPVDSSLQDSTLLPVILSNTGSNLEHAITENTEVIKQNNTFAEQNFKRQKLEQLEKDKENLFNWK